MDYYYDLYEEDPVRQYFYYLNSMIPWYWPSIKTTDTPWHADRIPNHKLIDGSKKLRLKDDSEFIRQRKIEHEESQKEVERMVKRKRNGFKVYRKKCANKQIGSDDE
jgi:hypothetical protein